MKATYNKEAETRWTSSHRKEGKCFFSSMQVVSLSDKPRNDGCLNSFIDCRLYGTGNLNTCCLWVRGVGLNGECTQGSGQAGGYGYHRPSEAMSRAIKNAGFTMSKDIGGVGESAMREALLAIAKCLKIKRPAIVESYP
jgi:hypothetical protein